MTQMISPVTTAFRGWLDLQQRVDAMDKLFVVGCGKSGTTWLMNLLNGHPQMVVNGEGRWAWALLPVLLQAFNAFNKDQSGRLELSMVGELDKLIYFRSIVNTGLARYIERGGAGKADLRVVGDKTPQHGVNMAPLAQTFPEAKFVHILRDPRDVTTSAWFHDGVKDRRGFEGYIRYFMNEVWPLNVGTTRKVGAQLGPARYIEVRYEDLHADERGQVRRVLGFLGVDTSEAALDACSEAGSFKNRSGGRTRGDGDNANFYRKGVTGDWRNVLPPALVEECVAKIAPLMRECGYEAEAPATV